jgi:hypothetical protein
MEPNDAISMGLIVYDFLLDHPSSLDPSVTSDEVAYELDWYMDWAVNDNVNLSFVAAVAEPGDAVEQLTGRTDTFLYGMVFASYSSDGKGAATNAPLWYVSGDSTHVDTQNSDARRGKNAQ